MEVDLYRLEQPALLQLGTHFRPPLP
jgi:hypothetical protein